MKLTDETNAATLLIRSYAANEVRVGDTILQQSFLISASQLVPDWRPQRIEDLSIEDIDSIVALDPEIVILGSGAKQRFPETRWLANLLSRGIGCEVMDTGAACRTYNVLVSEDRKVVGALMIEQRSVR
ncbi:MAG TPA: Mth938-like domain-containing protein [Steroidobacteraceae bacterium]|nr:Mth938-like domain-containing protein [Steroidobacteraceae bacterium]